MKINIIPLLILATLTSVSVTAFESDGEKERESIKYWPWKVKANYTLLGRGEARSSRDVTLYIDGIRMRNCVQSGPANVDSEGNIISARPAFIDEHTGDCGFL
ncbi:hypothetical protein CMK12_16935 [Candidatus Poribacteria bacterium]|nr:hypothetical protein [Candidatus Poribacteria bacterium]